MFLTTISSYSWWYLVSCPQTSWAGHSGVRALPLLVPSSTAPPKKPGASSQALLPVLKVRLQYFKLHVALIYESTVLFYHGNFHICAVCSFNGTFFSAFIIFNEYLHSCRSNALLWLGFWSTIWLQCSSLFCAACGLSLVFCLSSVMSTSQDPHDVLLPAVLCSCLTTTSRSPWEAQQWPHLTGKIFTRDCSISCHIIMASTAPPRSAFPLCFLSCKPKFSKIPSMTEI